MNNTSAKIIETLNRGNVKFHKEVHKIIYDRHA